MTILESLLLAFALCADTLAVSTASGLRYSMPKMRWLLLAFVMAFFQGLFPLMGALLGAACEQFITSVDHWIAFFLLLAVGGKMIIDAFRPHKESSPVDIASLGTMCLMGIATSIDAFAVGIGFGLSCSISQSLITCGIIAMVTFLVAVCGIFIGLKGQSVSGRWSSVLAGIVLISIGVKILLQHLS